MSWSMTELGVLENRREQDIGVGGVSDMSVSIG